MGIIGQNAIGVSNTNITNTDEHKMFDKAAYTYVAPANEQVFKFWFYNGALYSGDGAGVELGVYDITSGSDTAPLIATGVIGSLSLSTWNSITITPVALVEGNTYAIAMRCISATAVKVQDDYDSNAVSRSTLTGTSALAGAWDDNLSGGDVRSIYAETEATASGLTLDVTPSDNRVTESRSVTVSTPAVAPTTGNTEIKLTDDSGQAATVDSVTGSDPYVINYTFPRTTAKLFDATGYPIYVEVAAENVTSANVPFLPVTTQRFIDLSVPVATAGTYGAIYAGAVAATGDQRVHDIVSTSQSIPLDADGAAYGAEQDFWAIRSQPATTQTATFYLIQANGTVDVEDTITFVVETPVSESSGIVVSLTQDLTQNLTGELT